MWFDQGPVSDKSGPYLEKAEKLAEETIDKVTTAAAPVIEKAGEYANQAKENYVHRTAFRLLFRNTHRTSRPPLKIFRTCGTWE